MRPYLQVSADSVSGTCTWFVWCSAAIRHFVSLPFNFPIDSALASIRVVVNKRAESSINPSWKPFHLITESDWWIYWLLHNWPNGLRIGQCKYDCDTNLKILVEKKYEWKIILNLLRTFSYQQLSHLNSNHTAHFDTSKYNEQRIKIVGILKGGSFYKSLWLHTQSEAFREVLHLIKQILTGRNWIVELLTWHSTVIKALTKKFWRKLNVKKVFLREASSFFKQVQISWVALKVTDGITKLSQAFFTTVFIIMLFSMQM